MNIYKYKKTIEQGETLKKAVDDFDIKKIQNIFSDSITLRSLVLARGENNSFLNLIVSGFLFFLNDNNLLIQKSSDQEKIIKIIQEKIGNEEVLVFVSSVAYHLRDKDLFNLIFETVKKNKDILKQQNIYYWILHNVSSWQETVEDNSEESITLNKEIISNISQKSNTLLWLKAKVGLTYSKKILPKQKVDDYLTLVEQFRKIGYLYEVYRVEVEAARALVDLSRHQSEDELVFANLEKAKDIALEAFKVSKDIAYPNLEIISALILAYIYQERYNKSRNANQEIQKKYKNDKRKADSYNKQAEEFRAIFVYQTIYKPRYKETHFNYAPAVDKNK